MKRQMPLALLVIVSGMAALTWGAFSDVNSAKYWGKTGLKDLTETLDANFALIEVGQGEVAQSLTVTNGQAITSAYGTLLVVPTGACTNTIAAATSAGQRLTIINQGAGTILFVNDNSTLAVGTSNVTLGTNDVLTLIAGSTSKWIRESSADNN